MPDQARTGHTLRMYMVEALEAGVVSGAGDTRVHAVRVTLQGPVALCGAGPIAGACRAGSPTPTTTPVTPVSRRRCRCSERAPERRSAHRQVAPDGRRRPRVALITLGLCMS